MRKRLWYLKRELAKKRVRRQVLRPMSERVRVRRQVPSSERRTELLQVRRKNTPERKLP